MTVEEAVRSYSLTVEQAELLAKWEKKMLKLNPVYTITQRTVFRLLSGDKRITECKDT